MGVCCAAGAHIVRKDSGREKYTQIDAIRFVPKTRPRANPDLCQLASDHGPLSIPSLWEYTAMVLHVMQHADVQDAAVADLGSADGLLSWMALRQGARSVVGIDYDPWSEKQFRRTMYVNGFTSRNWRHARRDIREIGRTVRAIGSVDVIIANIGPHYYGADHAAIAIAAQIPSVRLFIAGGYLDNGKGPYGQYSAVQSLSRAGFSNYTSVTQEGDLPRTAFLMQRPVDSSR